MDDQHPGPAAFLIPALFVAYALVRNANPQNLRIERMWISPVIVIAATAMAFSQQGWPSDRMMLAYLVAAVVGAAVGWWRGRFTEVAVHPDTHQLTRRTSPVGQILLLAVFVLRFALRGFMQDHASFLHVSAAAITDTFLLLAVGLVCAQRLEIALRAARLLRAARAASAARPA